MTEDWDKSIAFVLEHEGGLTNDPRDPGGLTKYGISKRRYPNLDIAALTVEDAKKLYLRDFWTPTGCDELPWPFSVIVFDAAVNMGPKVSVRLLQLQLGVEPDGLVGPKTIEGAKRAVAKEDGGARAALVLLARRIDEYGRIIDARPESEAFSIDWAFRTLSLARFTAVHP